MIWKPFNADERQRLLETRSAALRSYEMEMNRIERCRPGGAEERDAVANAEEHLAAARMAESTYFDRLPRVVMSCCPFDGLPLVRTFDPYGFDGPWWRPDAAPEEPPGCPHFCLLRAAVRSAGIAAKDDSLHVGPRDPYVIPRILELPGMIAVIGQLEMADGAIVHPIAYFAPRRPPVQQLTAHWPRSVFLYTTALGQHRWRFDDRAEDFALAPWTSRGRVRWCDPESNNERLATAAPESAS